MAHFRVFLHWLRCGSQNKKRNKKNIFPSADYLGRKTDSRSGKIFRRNTFSETFLWGKWEIMEVGCHGQRKIEVSSSAPRRQNEATVQSRSARQICHFFLIPSSFLLLHSVPWQEGLRTLCVAYRPLSPPQYQEVCNLLNEAKLALQDRDKRLAEAYDLIEKDLILLGATAVEDRWRKKTDSNPPLSHT